MASLYQVKASAGSGKTYDLTRRFLCLLAACGAPGPAAASSCGLGSGPSGWDEILAITFTNAAAGEMRDRVIGRLKAIALGRPEKDIPQLTPDMAASWLDVILRDLALSLIHIYPPALRQKFQPFHPGGLLHHPAQQGLPQRAPVGACLF